MTKLSKAIAVLGVVAGLGVTALPLSSYAANPQSEEISINAKVGSVISLSVDSENVDFGTLNPDAEPVEKQINATVSTNNTSGYTLKISATETALKDNNNGNNYSIPAGVPTKSTSAWGIKGGDITTYEAITSTGNTLKNTSTVANSEKTEISFGITVSNTQQTGSYAGQAVITAATK